MSIRNIGIMAHVDAGKTTITEHMLYLGGRLHSIGSVDNGTASTDWLEVERRRGISVRSASTSFSYQGVEINLIDTPGHIDFAGEVERSLRVLDAAVLVISAAEGVEAQSEALWKALRKLDIPVIIFVNKIDRRASDTDGTIDEMKRMFSDNILPIQLVINENSREADVLDSILNRKNPEGDMSLQSNIEDRKKLNEHIYEFLAERDEDLMVKYLEEKPMPEEETRKKLKKMIQDSAVFPVIFGSALYGRGIEQLLNIIVEYLPAAKSNEEGPLAGLVYKIDHDPVLGKLSHLRLYSGSIETRDTVYNQTRDKYEKITQIKKAYANKYEDIGVLKAGDIGTFSGLKETYIGDVIGDDSYIPGDYKLANPLLKVEVKPADDVNITELIAALHELEEEDPLLNIEWLKEKREIHIRIMGIIQLEVLESILLERYKLKVFFGKPSVIYKETPSKSGEGFESYTMPKPCWAILRFKIEPGERGSGVEYHSEVRSDVLPLKYQKQVEKTIPTALEQGLYGWEVTDLKITLTFGEYHIEHTHAPDFMVATPMAIMNGLANTGTTLLEPILWFQITVPEDLSGRIIGDLIQMRASYENPRIKDGKFMIEGTVPAATSLDYPIKISSISAGKGIIKTRFYGYQKCSLEEGATCPRRGVNPLDRSKYILSVRNAL